MTDVLNQRLSSRKNGKKSSMNISPNNTLNNYRELLQRLSRVDLELSIWNNHIMRELYGVDGEVYA